MQPSLLGHQASCYKYFVNFKLLFCEHEGELYFLFHYAECNIKRCRFDQIIDCFFLILNISDCIHVWEITIHFKVQQFQLLWITSQWSIDIINNGHVNQGLKFGYGGYMNDIVGTIVIDPLIAFFALLSLCEQKPLITDGLLSQRASRTLTLFLVLDWTKLFNKLSIFW